MNIYTWYLFIYLFIYVNYGLSIIRFNVSVDGKPPGVTLSSDRWFLRPPLPPSTHPTHPIHLSLPHSPTRPVLIVFIQTVAQGKFFIVRKLLLQ